MGAVAALLCGCDKDDNGDDALGVGAKLSVDYLGDSDVVGFHYLIERVSCSPGDPIEPFAFEALVDLQDQLAPGGVTILDVFDGESGHVFADVFVTLDPGCYDVTATPASEMDMVANTWTPSSDCSVASEDGVEVLPEETAVVPTMISQCEGDPNGAPSPPVVLNHPPEFSVSIDDRFGFECEILEVCASVSDPDNDPMELVWSQTSGAALFEPISVGPLTETVFDAGRQYYEQCATFVSEDVGDYGFDVTVYDLLADGTRIEDALDAGLESNASMAFPLFTSRGVEPACVGAGGVLEPLGETIDRAPGCAWQDAAAYYCDPANAADAGFPLSETCPGGVFDPTAAFGTCDAKIVFTSSATFSGDFGGIAGADAQCQSLADAAGLSGTFLAWLGDSTTDPATRFAQSASPYVLVDGTVVADDWADLTDGGIDNPIALTENGAVPSVSLVWTGTSAAGVHDGIANTSCNDWSPLNGSDNGLYGTWDLTLPNYNDPTDWSDLGLVGSCIGLSHALYCFEQ